MLSFGLNSFSPVSLEFSVVMCLQRTTAPLHLLLCETKRAKPLTYHPAAIPQAVLYSSSIFDKQGLPPQCAELQMRSQHDLQNRPSAAFAPLETCHQGHPPTGFAFHGWITLMTIFILTGSVTQCVLLIFISS